MLWDTSSNAGFTTPEAKPWLPLMADHATVNVAVEGVEPSNNAAERALRRHSVGTHSAAG